MSIEKIKSQLFLLKIQQNSNYGNNITTINYYGEYIKLKEQLKRLEFIENRKNKYLIRKLKIEKCLKREIKSTV